MKRAADGAVVQLIVFVPPKPKYVYFYNAKRSVENMKYGICYCYWSKDWEGTDYPAKIERARSCGFDILEIFYGRTLTMEQRERDEIKAACKANDVEIYCSGGFGRDRDLSALDEAQRKSAVERSKEIARALSAIGATNFSGINYGAWCDFDNPDKKPQLMAQAAKSLKEVGALAGELGISWNVEVVNRFESCLLNTAAEARELTDAVDSPNVNILLDIFHGMVEEDDLAQAVSTAGSRLGHYHVGANNRGLPKPGGFLPWAEIGAAMRDVGYNKSVSFEPLVNQGGTVALEGGNVWRPMLPTDADDKALDEMLMQSLAFVKQNFGE